MSWLAILNVVALVAVGTLVLLFLRMRTRDQLEAIAVKRRPESRIAERADFVDGHTHFPVVLSLTDKAIFYENMDLAAQIDLERIEEVEYTDELTMGGDTNGRVLRLRSHGHTFEFVLTEASAARWGEMLPKHLYNDPGKVHTV
ncbi:MAG TPA: hypothetical protein VMS12_08065 [Thermoanaerobaculia bacterium]|nr:hypothetical protein [Thermoanaerobaculia bacterium]